DYVSAGGVEGTVTEIGLFGTTLNTPDNVQTLVGNNTIFSGTVHNYSHNRYRRVDRLAPVAHRVDVHDAINRPKDAVAQIPNVLSDPPPDVEIHDFTAMGPVLAVRPYTHTDHYWQVYFATNAAIADTFGTAGYPAPETVYRVHQGGRRLARARRGRAAGPGAAGRADAVPL